MKKHKEFRLVILLHSEVIAVTVGNKTKTADK